MRRRILIRYVILLLLGMLGGWLASSAGYTGAWTRAQDDFPDVCAESADNLVRNCQFNEGMSHWNTFVEAGGVPIFGVEHTFPACDSPKCPALRIYASDWFVGGVYQPIHGVVPGATYWANVIWLVYHPAGQLNGTVGRRIGIDPTGGTDPTSPAIVWSPEIWHRFDSCPYKICRELQVQATAQNTTITLFIRIAATWKQRRAEFAFVPVQFFSEPESFWIDDVGLIPVGDVSLAMTMPQPEVPTDTPLPVAPIVPNTATWIVESTLASGIASAPTETATATVTPSATPTSTWTRLPTITPTATRTPTSTRPTRLPTSTPRPTATATPQIFFFAGALPFLGGGILCLGGGVFTLSVLSGMIWMGIRRGNVHKMAPARCHPLHARHPVAPSASSQGRRMDASLSHREGSPESGPKIEREDDLDDRSA